MKHILAVFAFFISINVAHAYYDLEEGSYDCEGYDPVLQRNYKAYVTINLRDDHFVATWDYGNGERYDGVGLVHDEEDEVTAFTFREEPDRKKYNKNPIISGLKVYYVDDENLWGRTIILGSNKVGNENCVKREN